MKKPTFHSDILCGLQWSGGTARWGGKINTLNNNNKKMLKILSGHSNTIVILFKSYMFRPEIQNYQAKIVIEKGKTCNV